jgi:hypothetical protein
MEEFGGHLLGSVEILETPGVEIPEIVPAVSAEEGTAHSIGSGNPSVIGCRPESVIQPLLPSHNNGFHIQGALERIKGEFYFFFYHLYFHYILSPAGCKKRTVSFYFYKKIEDCPHFMILFCIGRRV